MSDGIRLARDSRINVFERMSGGRARLHELMRQLHAIGLDLSVIRNPQVFASSHVEQFLQGAAARTGARTDGQRGDTCAPSSPPSKTRSGHNRVEARHGS
jgi:hypothetical protein